MVIVYFFCEKCSFTLEVFVMNMHIHFVLLCFPLHSVGGFVLVVVFGLSLVAIFPGGISIIKIEEKIKIYEKPFFEIVIKL